MKEEKKPYRGIEALLGLILEDVDLHYKKGSSFKFTMYITPKMEQEEIEVLELSERARNCLKRANIHRIGELAELAQHSNDLMKLRNCGSNTVAEIMEKLFVYQFMKFRPERQEKYLIETVKKNL